MTVTPDGDPIWAKTSDYTTYGGHADKQNYQSQGAISPRTDVTAEQFCRLVEDMAECSRTAPFAQFSITCNDSGTPAPPTINWARMATGVRASSYEGDAPPTGFPGAVRNSDGVITMTFEASYDDAFGVTAAFAVEHVITSPASSSCAYVNWSVVGAALTITAFDSSGNPLADAEYTFEVA